MTNKIFKALLFNTISIVLPMYPNIRYIGHPTILILLVVMTILIVSQPDVPIPATIDNNNNDLGSMQVIILVVILSLWFVVYEWARNLNVTISSKVNYFSIALIISGLSLRRWAIICLGEHFCSVVTITKNHRLIYNGPYRYLRHPSYTGAILVFWGIFSMVCIWQTQIVLTLSITIAYLYRIYVEEKALKIKFGDEFENYRIKSYALIPFLY